MSGSAIVTMVVGEQYQTIWRRFCAPNWQRYARRHGFDLYAIDHPLDVSEVAQRRGYSWQKFLIGTVEVLKQYECLIWIDADVVINAEAPSILDGAPPDRVGAVHYHALLRQPLFEAAHRRICRGHSPQAFCATIFGDHALTADPDCMIQGGVLTVPRNPLPILERTYRKYSEAGTSQQQEQPFLSYELSAAGVTHFLDDKFNAVWYEYKEGLYFGDQTWDLNRVLVRRVLSEIYFLHFAGNIQDMLLLADGA